MIIHGFKINTHLRDKFEIYYTLLVQQTSYFLGYFFQTFFGNKQFINIYFFNQRIGTPYSLCDHEISLRGLKNLHNKISAAALVITLYKREYFPAFLFRTNNNNKNIHFFYFILLTKYV